MSLGGRSLNFFPERLMQSEDSFKKESLELAKKRERAWKREQEKFGRKNFQVKRATILNFSIKFPGYSLKTR